MTVSIVQPGQNPVFPPHRPPSADDHDASRASRALMKMHALNVCTSPSWLLFVHNPSLTFYQHGVIHHHDQHQRTAFVSSFTRPLLKVNPYRHNNSRSSTRRITPHGRTPMTMMTSGRRNDDNDDNDDDDDDDMVVSRRVFLAGTAVSSLITATMSYRFFVGDDVDLEIRRRLSEIAPVWLQSLSLSPTPFVAGGAPPTSRDDDGGGGSRKRRRGALDEGFARLYFDTLERVAIQQGIVSSAAELHKLEEETKRLAKPLFFPSSSGGTLSPTVTATTTTGADAGVGVMEPVRETLGDERWFNFVLYTRLRVLSRQTSPLERTQFSSAVATATLPCLLLSSGTTTTNNNMSQCNTTTNAATTTTRWTYAPAQDADAWLHGLDTVLQSLVSKGWVSSFRVNGDGEFDTTTWAQEHRGVLSVYAYDVVTMQSCQLIAEEMYEEMAPKISGWVTAFLTGRCGLNVSKEDYYLDEVYRADASMYRPTVLATEMDLSFGG